MPNENIFGDSEDLRLLSEVGVTLITLQCNPGTMAHRLVFRFADGTQDNRVLQKERIENYVFLVLDGKDVSFFYDNEAKSDWTRYYATFHSTMLAVPQPKPVTQKRGAQPF